MIKMSQIRFRNFLDDPEQARLPDKFIEEFHTGSLLYKCDKFCFNSPENWIEYDDMFTFIEQFAATMKELTIFGTYIRNALYELSMDDLVKLIPTQLTKLEIVTDRVKTKLIISIDRLKNIKTLKLGGCILKMIDGAVCAPVEISLKNVYFLGKRKHFPKSVKLNDLFDFRNLKDLHIDCSETENVELDVSVGSIELKTLNLERVTIHNWESSTWTVEKLTLCRKTGRTLTSGMRYEELDYDARYLDIAILPPTIKSLTLRRFQAKLIHVEQAENLTELKSLSLHRKRFSVLSAFANCANLTHLHLYPMDDGDARVVSIDVKLIPKTVKVLRLSHNCELMGKMDLDTVIFAHMPFRDAYDFLVENLNAKNVLFYCSSFDFDTNDEAGVDKAVEELNLQRYVLGPFFQSDRERYAFLYYPFLEENNARADFLIKTDHDAAVIKREIFRTEFDRLENAWWTKDKPSF